MSRELSLLKEFSPRYPHGTELIPSTPVAASVIQRMVREQVSTMMGAEHPPIDVAHLRFYATSIFRVLEEGIIQPGHTIHCLYNGKIQVFDIPQGFFRPVRPVKTKEKIQLRKSILSLLRETRSPPHRAKGISGRGTKRNP